MAGTYWQAGSDEGPSESPDVDDSFADQVGRLQEDSTIVATGTQSDTLSPGLLSSVTTTGDPASTYTASKIYRDGIRAGVDNSVNFYGNVDGDVSKALERERKERIRRTRTTKVGG